jgi:hypothetical protein
MSGDPRQRGVLSEADRAYLRGERGFSSVQAERNARARIRDRIYEAVRDFELLVEGLDERDRELVFAKRFGDEGTEAFDALVAAIAFLYQGVDDTDLAFETVLHEAINVAVAGEDRAATVDLEVTFQSLTVEGLRRKLDRGESLSLTEIAYLHRSDEIGNDELARYFREEPTDVDDGRIQAKVTEF